MDAIPPKVIIDNKQLFDELFKNTVKENIDIFASNPNSRSLYENKFANQLGINIVKYYHESLVNKQDEMNKQNAKRKAFLQKLSNNQENNNYNKFDYSLREDD